MSKTAGPQAPLPIRDGVAPSYVWLPEGAWPNLLSFLTQQFPFVATATWQARLDRGEVRERSGERLHAGSAAKRGMCIFYYRELGLETVIPFDEQILYRDERLLVVDKPHFLPVIPGGRFLQQTLLVRLKKKFDLPDLTPIHRLDRETAGVVIFSVDAATRGAYQGLFQQRAIDKVYEALAPAMRPELASRLPMTYRSRIVPGTPFFCMREAPGEPNAQTAIEIIEARGADVLYRLRPLTGKQHQLRVQMAALGSPIINDAFYPTALACKGDDFSRPLQLLARSIGFIDPVGGAACYFESARTLGDASAA